MFVDSSGAAVAGVVVILLLISIPTLIIMAIRQRTPHYETVSHQNDPMEMGNGDLNDDETIPTVPVHGQHPDQQNKGRFLGFLLFLVVFFDILAIIVSKNFFVTKNDSSLLIKVSSIQNNTNFLSFKDCLESKENWRSDELLGVYGGTVTDYQFPITTKSSRAQQLFAQGLTHLFGFNQKEAERNFKFAVSEDPECAIGVSRLR
jgi:hypothetical protein